MNKSMEDMCARGMFYFAAGLAVVSVAVVFILLILTAYVRWTTNQAFTFLGGTEFEALTLSAFALTYATARMHFVKKCCGEKDEAHCIHCK